jgi:Family of unknown function (DUF6308)
VGAEPERPIPQGWAQPPPELYGLAKHKALQAMRIGGLYPAPARLARFYDVAGDYAGASLAELRPIDPLDFTPSDILATTLMSVRIGPGATRRILQDGTTREALLHKLRGLPDVNLACAGISELTGMASLYEEVKRALSAASVKRPDAWVTASKLCARKRPDLYPVRDRDVRDHLGLSAFRNYQVDWQIFRSFMGDDRILTAIDQMAKATDAAAAGRKLRLDHSRLRLLDAAIWTFVNPPMRTSS